MSNKNSLSVGLAIINNNQTLICFCTKYNFNPDCTRKKVSYMARSRIEGTRSEQKTLWSIVNNIVDRGRVIKVMVCHWNIIMRWMVGVGVDQYAAWVGDSAVIYQWQHPHSLSSPPLFTSAHSPTVCGRCACF